MSMSSKEKQKPRRAGDDDLEKNWLPPGARSLGVFRDVSGGKAEPVVVEVSGETVELLRKAPKREKQARKSKFDSCQTIQSI